MPTPWRVRNYQLGSAACALAASVSIGSALLQGQAARPDAPPAAYSVGAAFDAGRERLVVFGGYVAGTYIGDTWEWDGSAWTRIAVPGPSARNSPALVYDEARGQIVLFGGDTRSTGALGDTWLYDGAQWRQVAVEGPPPRTTHTMVYDAQRRRVVLFGGSNGTHMLRDTWEWDGAHWAQAANSGPSARTLYGMAYDAGRGRVVLFGGTHVLAPDAPGFSDTWEWSGVRWTRVKADGPSPRDHVMMGYDPVRRQVVLHGGGTGPVSPGETWTFDGRTWTKVSSSGPRRRWARLAFDTRARAMLLYGGFDREPSNELWRLEGSTWSRLAP